MTDWRGFAFLNWEFAVHGEIVVNGVDQTAADLGILMLDGTSNPVIPPTEDRVMRIPGRHGQWYFGADITPRRIIIPCAFIDAVDRSQLLAHARALRDYLLDSDHEPEDLLLAFEADLTATDPLAGTAYRVRYSGESELSLTVTTGEFELSLVVNDPEDGELQFEATE
jgi:hypothetical protein